MKNIALVITSLNGGGAEKVILTLASEFVKLGHEVQILSIQPQCDYTIPHNICVNFLFSEKQTSLISFWNLKKNSKILESWFLKQPKIFDLILSNLDEVNLMLSQSCLKNVYYIIHRSIEEELKSEVGLFNFSFKKAKRALEGKDLICVSQGIEQEIFERKRFKPNSCQTIYNPFNIDEIRSLSSQPIQFMPNKTNINEPYLIHVGRIARAKRLELLFEAFSLMAPHYKLVLLCDKPKKAIKKASKFGVENRLIFPGFQQNPYNWIKNADLLLLSSDYEGFGNVLAESIIIGTPVVSTDCPHGPNEILTGELEEYLTPLRDAKALANAATKALSYQKISENADIVGKVDALKVAKQYLSLCH